MTISPFHHHKRREFSAQERAKFFAAAGEQCAKCTRKLARGEDWDLDHIIALENGGTNDDANFQVLCDWCHKPKASDDHKRASKSKRIYTNHVVPGRFKRSKAWR